jgi:hypothetical protein
LNKPAGTMPIALGDLPDFDQHLRQGGFGRVERRVRLFGECGEGGAQRGRQPRRMQTNSGQLRKRCRPPTGGMRCTIPYQQPAIGNQAGVGVPRHIGKAQLVGWSGLRIVWQQADADKASHCPLENAIERAARKAERYSCSRESCRARIGAPEVLERERRLQEQGAQPAISLQAGVGHDLPTLMAVKMVVADLVGDRLGMGAYRRAADPQPFGRAGDPAFLDKRKKRLDMRQGDHGSRMVRFALVGGRRPHGGVPARSRPTGGARAHSVRLESAERNVPAATTKPLYAHFRLGGTARGST